MKLIHYLNTELLKKLFLISILFILFLLKPYFSFSTHLMGGDFSYKFLYYSNGFYYYKIRIDMYRDCQNSTTPFDYSIYVGVYNNDLTRSKYRDFTLYMGTETQINPPSGGSKCSWAPNVCIKHTYYEETIALPPSTVGYHLYHVRCCRNNLVNIVWNTGQTYYAFIPPTSYANNSAYFQSIPTPYICAQDTVYISYSAQDNDGDSLVYELAHPFAGGTDQDPAPLPPANLGLPIQKAPYKTGFSVYQPFGNGGVCSIDPSSGLLKIMVPNAGFYAIAVDVKEYRNGVLISTVRRDVELIVLSCPPNFLPKLIDPIITTFIIEEGNTLSFDIIYTDKDSMFLTKEGEIFGPSSSIPSPYATLTNVSGKDTIKNKFEWKTSCEHGRQTPYFFTVRVTDNGCPPKTTVSIFQIIVQPFKGPDSISGPVSVCEYTDSVKYDAFGTSKNSLIVWNVIGGNTQSPQGKTDVKIGWGKAGTGIIELYETSKNGCGPVKKTKQVKINPLPVVDAGKDLTICSMDSVQLGTIPADTLAKYFWNTSRFLSDSTLPQPVFSARNISGNPVSYKYFLFAENKNKCRNFDSVTITVNPEPDTSSITGVINPCFMGIFHYQTKNNAGSVYHWTVSGGEIVKATNSYEIDIKWTDTLKGKVGVYEINKYGCRNDTQFLHVNIVKPGGRIYGPPVVCPNTVNIDYWVKERPGSKYYWFVENGTRADGIHNKSAIKVNWPDSGLAMIKVVEVTKEGCVSDTTYFPVIISYHLKTSPIEGDTFVCEFELKPYQVINSNGSTYQWSVSGGNLLAGNGKNKIDVMWGTQGKGLMKVLETSYDSVNDKICIGDTVYQQVIINPIPHTSPVSGDTSVCEYDTSTYSVSGFTGSVFLWEISDTAIAFNGQKNNQISVFWGKEGTYRIRVTELTKDSCTSSPVDLWVNVHPNPRTSPISGADKICYPDNNNIPYQVTGFTNSTYQWTVNGGTPALPSSSDHIQINWSGVDFGQLTVVETTQFGCTGLPVTKKIAVDSLAPFVELVTTMPDNDQIIGIYWSLANPVHLNKKAYLYKNDELTRSWELLDSFNKNILSTIDLNVKTSEKLYNYRIQVENQCHQMLYSQLHRNILLTGEKITEFDVRLKWSSYVNWPEGVDNYAIYRKSDKSGKFSFVQNVSPNDSVVEIDAALAGINQCYRVVAVRNNKPDIQSWSNEICFVFDPVVYIPNAFTPNGDGLNDLFEVKAANIHTYKLEIYNRWGELIFTSDSPNVHWDGKYNGKDCPVDVYVVIIHYQGNSTPKTYTGTVTLVR